MRKNKSTFWYGAAYLICIPLFALIYSKIPGGFYQSTIKIENSYTEHARNIAGRFCSAIAQLPPPPKGGQDSHAPQPKTFKVSGYTFSLPDMKCNNLRIEKDDRLEFAMNVTLHKTSSPCPQVLVKECYDSVAFPFIVTLGPFDIKTGASELLAFEPPVVGIFHPISFKTLALPYDSPSESNESLTRELVKVLFLGFGGVPAILLDGDFDKELADFLWESSGFTSSTGDNGLRMLYFSAVTITTIGYGDIVPIKPCARIAVTCEAILGALLIGLFFSSMAPRGPR
jgi:Ion channel